MTSRRELWIGALCACAVACLWTGFLLASRLGIKGDLTPFDLCALRFGVSGLVMLPFIARNGLGGLTLLQALALVMTAGLGFALLVFTGFTSAPAAHASVLLPGLLPLWTALLAIPLLGEWPRGLRAAGLAGIALGVAVLIGSVIVPGGLSLAGDLFFAAGSFCWAIFTVLARRWNVAPLNAAAIVSVGSAILYMPLYVTILPGNLAAVPLPELLAQAIFQGLFVTIGAIWFFARALQALGPGPLTGVLAIVPALSALLAVPVLGEPIEPGNALGLMFITAGMAMIVWALVRTPSPASVEPAR